ncbi:hypothetical protein MAR_011896 [Mya arenaria]|uniref:Ig-like domain-containing protein n=1 Tax=Mya arenaria TaxID=6604 RepID=A0ABY7FX17_MYAAR|nr:hypothetical protein MAR_011896 [Mya arenaria]
MMDSEKAVFHMVVLFMNVLTSICRGEQIRLSPEVSELVIAEGNRLQLDCIHDNNKNAQSAYFTKNGEIVTLDNDDDYMITSKSRMINATIGTRQTIKTLVKDSTAPTDNGVFACKSGNIEASINVIVFKDGHFTSTAAVIK